RRGVSPADEPRDLPAALSVPGRSTDHHQHLEDVADLPRDLYRHHAVCRADHWGALDPARFGDSRLRREPAGEHVEVHPHRYERAGDHPDEWQAGASGILSPFST